MSKKEPNNVLLSLRGIGRSLPSGGRMLTILDNIDLDVRRGEFVAVLGASGSGKSTLLHLLGDLDQPDRNAGSIVFDGKSLRSMSGRQRNRYRNRDVGFIFQFYHLLPELTTLENVLMPALIARKPMGQSRERAATLLQSLGLAEDDVRRAHRGAPVDRRRRRRYR